MGVTCPETLREGRSEPQALHWEDTPTPIPWPFLGPLTSPGAIILLFLTLLGQLLVSFNVGCQLPLLINIHIPNHLTALLQGPSCKVPFVGPLSQPNEFSLPLPLPSPDQAGIYFCMASLVSYEKD